MQEQGRVAQGIADALRLHQRVRGIAVVHQQRELLAAQPAEAVAGPDGPLHDLRVVAQRGVAPRMAVAVVDGLEMVDIQHQHGQLAAGALAAPQFTIELVQDAAPRIGPRQAVESQRGLHLLGQARLHQQQQRQE
ncbi:hypothetical protein D9M69_622620 [compost metagenome]